MNVCSIGNNAEFKDSIADYINASIKESLATKEPFKLFTVLDDIFKAINEGEETPIKALGAAAMVPQLFFEVLKAEKDHLNDLLEQNFDIKKVKELEKQIAESKDPIKLVEQLLSTRKVPTVAEMAANTLIPKTVFAEIKKVVSDLKAFTVRQLSKATLLATTGRTGIKIGGVFSITKVDTTKALDYTVLQNIISAQLEKGQPFNETEYSGNKGFKLKVIVEDTMPNPSKNLYKGSTPTDSLIATLVNNKGEYYYFDEAGKITTEDKGKIAYYPLKSTDQAKIDVLIENLVEQAKSVLKEETKDTPEDFEGRVLDARKYYTKQIEAEALKIKEIEANVRKGSNVLLRITGGSLGVIDNPDRFPTAASRKEAERTVSEFTGLKDKEKSTIYFDDYEVKPGKLIPVPALKIDTYGSLITMKGLKISTAAPEILKNMIDILVDDLVHPDGKIVTPEEKIKLFIQFSNFSQNKAGSLDVGGLNISNINGELVIKIKNDFLNLTNKEEAKATLNNFLKDIAFFTYIKSDRTDVLNLYDNFFINDGVLTTKEEPYKDFIFKYLTLRAVYDENTKRPIVHNGYFKFELDNIEEVIQEKAEAVLAKSEKIVNEKKAKDIKGLGDLMMRSKLIEARSTPEQKEAADKWVATAQILKDKDADGNNLLTITDARDIVNSDAFATFANATVTLYKGFNSTHMYHESWHVFSQMYLTPEQRTKLYEDASNFKGSFSVVKKFGGPGGNTVQRVKLNFADLKADLKSKDPDVVADARLALEEFIAEEFRKFAMNNGKFKVNDPNESVFGKIFKRIWAFFKAILRGSLPVNTYANPGSNGAFSEMFTALYNAKEQKDLNMYAPTIANAEFGTLNLGVMAPNGRLLLSGIDAQLLSNSIDGIISETTTSLLTDETEPQYGAALDIFQNPKYLAYIYDVIVKNRLTERLEELIEEKKENEDSWNILEKDYHINKIRQLHQGLKHFGNINALVENKSAENSLVAYHLQNSAFKDVIKRSIIDPTDVEVSDLSKYLSKVGDKTGNEVASEKLASTNALYIIKSLVQQEYNEKGQRINTLNSLGFPQTIEFLPFWNFLMNKVSGEQNLPDLYNKMVSVTNSKINPHMDQLMVKLGDINVVTDENKLAGNIWLGMLDSLNQANVQLINMIVTETVTDKKVFGYDVHVGKVSSEYFKIKNSVWKNKFSLETSKYVELNSDKENVLKLDLITKTFLNKKLDNSGVYRYSLKAEKSPIEFLNAIGIYMSSNYEIKNGIDITSIPFIADAIGQANLNQASIKNIVKYFDEVHSINVEKIINGKAEFVTRYMDKGENKPYIIEPLTSRINALAELEAEYSLEYGSQMKPVADGKKSVFTLNSTLSKIIYGIKKAQFVDEFVDYTGNYGYLPHLHKKNNPALSGSVYHKNLFDGSGKKREGVELEMFELVGAQYVSLDGTVKAVSPKGMTDADTFKSVMYSYLAEGYMEAVRAAGKSTYYASRMNKIITYSGKKSPHLFIDPEAFMKNKDGKYVFGVNPIAELNKIMFAKLEGELKRIDKINKGITKEQAIELGLDPEKINLKNFYKDNVKGFEFGGKFDWFHDILESETGGEIKDKLISEYADQLDNNSLIDLLNKDVNFKFLIEEKILSYFETLKDRARKDYDKSYEEYTESINPETGKKERKVIVPEFLKALATKHLNSNQKTAISNEAVIDGMLMSYVVNAAIHSDEMIIIQFGDGFQFDHSKNEGPKRIPTYNSPGKIFASDNITRNILNKFYGRPYEAKLIADGKISKKKVREFAKVGNKFIIAESVVKSPRYNQFHELFLSNFKKRNYSEDEIKELLYGKENDKYGTLEKPFSGSIMDTYGKIKDADGQGLISFDYYRLLHVIDDNWSKAQEEAFQREINGEFIAPQDLTELFPVYKLQHAGPLATPLGMYPIQSIDKFALLPAIPSLMIDTNYEVIHNQMVDQDGDYLLFPSGSKRSHIKAGKNINGDEIYEGNTGKLKQDFIDGKLKFTKNPFFIDYLKNQTEVNNYFKEENTLSTQFRKVFNTGLYDIGVPVDYTGSKEAWDKLSDKQKLKESEVHKKTEAVFDRLERLTGVFKTELLNEMGTEILNGKPVLDADSINNMIVYLRKKLVAQGYSEHEISIFQSDNGKAPDVSPSPEAARFEKLLMAVVNNRLVKLKVFGEAYVQVSGAFFQKFTNPTEKQKAELSDFGEEGGYVVDVTGKKVTLGCKVKVALTDNYRKLYKTSYFAKNDQGEYVNSGETVGVYKKVEGKKYKVIDEEASFIRLNEMIRVNEWKADDKNKKKIQITGVRIPTQGPNSVEFAEIWEFLSPASGPIIIIPAEVIAKSGGDFDVDKLTMYIKKISRQGSLIEDTYNTPEDIQPEINDLKAKLKELKADKLTISNSLDKFRKEVYYAVNYVPMTDEQKRNFTTKDDKKLLETLNNAENQKFLKTSIKKAYKIYDKNIKSFNVEEYEDVENILNDLYGKDSELSRTIKKLSDLEEHQTNFSSAIQNSLIDDFIKVMELPQMAFSLLLPNGTYLVKKYADELKDAVQISDKKTNFEKSIQTGKKISDISKGISPTRLREPDFNKSVKQDNITGKNVLGILALDTPFNNLNNMAGTIMESSIDEEVFVTGNLVSKILTSPITLKLNHNSQESTELGKKLLVISLSNVSDAEKKNQIADVFNQLMNGAVDVEKDPWIAYIQGNMEVIPKMVFLLQAGVPFADIAYFVTNPMIREHVQISQDAKSTLAELTYGPRHSAYSVIKAKKNSKIAPARALVKEDITNAEDTLYELYKMLDEYTNQMESDAFTTSNLKQVAFSSMDLSTKDIKNDIPQKQLAGFLQYLYIEKLIEDYDFMKGSINVDTNVTNSTYFAEAKLRDLRKADKIKTINKKALNYHVNKGPLRSFHVQDFAINLIGKTFFPSRSNSKINNFLLEVSERKPGQMSELKIIERQTGLNEESFEPRFKNALSLFTFTNSLNSYKKGDTEYNKVKISDLINENSPVKSLDEIAADFDAKKYSQTYKEADSYLNKGLYPMPDMAIKNLNTADFIHINLEREYLRNKVMPFSKTLLNSKEFKLVKTRLLNTGSPVFQKMSAEDLNRLVYENMLMHTSLLNTYNSWEMFESGDNTVAQKLLDIIENYGEDLKYKYQPLIERFAVDTLQGTDKVKSRKNFYIKAIRDIDSKTAGDYNRMWEGLANPSAHKVTGNTPEALAANKYISDFFDKLPIFAFLQSGMDPGTFNMSKIMPLDKYLPIMQEASKDFENNQLSKKESNLILKGFLELFKKNNNMNIQHLKGRGVSYKKTINALLNESHGVSIYSSPFIQPLNDNVYQLNDSLTEYGRTVRPSNDYIKSLKKSNALATFLLTDEDFNIAFNLTTPEQLEEAKTNIDTLLNTLKSSDNPIVISSKGFGQSVRPTTTTGKIAELEQDIKTLPIEIYDSIDIVDTVSDELLGNKDISFAMKDVFEENGITDPLLVNWAGINKGYFGHPRNIKSTKQLESLVEKVYDEKKKESKYIEFKSNPLALQSFKEWKKALAEYPLVFQDIMLTHAIKHITNPQRKSKYVLQLSKVALTNTYGILLNKPNEANRLGKLYDEEVLKTVSDSVGHEPAASGNGYWVHVPRTEKFEKFVEGELPQSFTKKEYAGDRDYTHRYFIENNKYFVNKDSQLFEDGFSRKKEITKEEYIKQSKNIDGSFEKGNIEGQKSKQFTVNIELLRKLSPSTWCTSGGMAEHYVENYDNYVLIVDGVTVAGVEAYPQKTNWDLKPTITSITKEEYDNAVEESFKKSNNIIGEFTEDGETYYVDVTENIRYSRNGNNYQKYEHKKVINPKIKVKEVTSRANNGMAPINYLDDVIAFFEKHNLDLNNDSLNRAVRAKERGETDINIPSDFDDNVDNEYQDWLDQQERIAIDRYNGEYEMDPPMWQEEGAIEYERDVQVVNDIETIEEALNHPLSSEYFAYLKPELRADERLANRAIDYDAHNIAHINNALPFYNELAIRAVTRSPYVFNYISEAAKDLPGLREIYTNYNIDDDLPFSKTDTNLIQGYYDAKNDKVVVVAENTPVNEGAKVAIHEVAHRGMLRMAKELGGVQELGKALFAAEDQLMKKLPELLKRTGHKSLESLMLDYGFTTQSEEGKIKLLMELAARWAETLTDKSKPSWWKKLVDSISKWITKFTGKVLNEEEVNELIGGFVRYGVKSGQTTPANNPTEFTNYHGGAKKYDTYWEQEGKKSGVTKHTVYTTGSYDKLDQTTKDKLDVKYDAARTWLGRGVLARNTYNGKLVRRDMMQAAKADGIFGISEIVAPGVKGRLGYVNKLNHPVIEGGTGYAAASAILQGKPVYIFNQDSNYGFPIGWYEWNNASNTFIKTKTPSLTKNFAGIGDHVYETEIGRQAVKDVYANTFKATTQPSTSVNEFDLADKLTPIEQNFADGTGGRAMQPQFKDKSTMDLIISGDRTRTTRAKTDIQRMAKDYSLSKISDLVGKVIRMTDKTGRQVYTRITKVVPFTQEYQDATWQKEGWEKSVTDKHVGDYPYAIEFKVVDKSTTQPQAPQNSSLNQELSLYLSEQLDKNLGYTNPGSVVVPSIKDIVDNMPNITEADINNNKLKCK